MGSNIPGVESIKVIVVRNMPVARRPGDIGAGPSEMAALDANGRFALFGEVPSHCFAGVARPDNDVAIRFHDKKFLLC